MAEEDALMARFRPRDKLTLGRKFYFVLTRRRTRMKSCFILITNRYVHFRQRAELFNNTRKIKANALIMKPTFAHCEFFMCHITIVLSTCCANEFYG